MLYSHLTDKHRARPLLLLLLRRGFWYVVLLAFVATSGFRSPDLGQSPERRVFVSSSSRLRGRGCQRRHRRRRQSCHRPVSTGVGRIMFTQMWLLPSRLGTTKISSPSSSSVVTVIAGIKAIPRRCGAIHSCGRISLSFSEKSRRHLLEREQVRLIAGHSQCHSTWQFSLKVQLFSTCGEFPLGEELLQDILLHKWWPNYWIDFHNVPKIVTTLLQSFRNVFRILFKKNGARNSNGWKPLT